jgi:twitching motility two-component system response regulator PilH
MKKILIVDDSSAELANLRSILEQNGWHSVTATSGVEALRKAVIDKPNLILMDIVMPDMDGYEACRALHAEPATKEIPIVFVSSKNQKADQLWAKMQGGKALISKPYAPQQILDALKAYA